MEGVHSIGVALRDPRWVPLYAAELEPHVMISHTFALGRVHLYL